MSKSKTLGNDWYNTNVCYQNDWLYKGGRHQWTLTPRSLDSISVFFVYYDGAVYRAFTSGDLGVRPVVYLKSTAKITSGNGIVESPFILGA